MVLNLLEYPVIAVDEARVLGQMKGVVMQDNRLVSIYYSMKDEHYMQIQIDDALIGLDAVIVKKTSMANMLSSQGKIIDINMDVYNCSGKFIGRLTAIDVNDDRYLNGICIEDGYIKTDRIIGIRDVIVIDSDDKEEQYIADENDMQPLEVQEVRNHGSSEEQVIEEQKDGQKYIGEYGNKEYTEEACEKEFMDSVSPVPSADEESKDETADSVNPRYKYLLGKRLIKDVIIENRTYPNDSIISAELIDASIKNNSILNLIMNAED